jgi:hypothetical protein
MSQSRRRSIRSVQHLQPDRPIYVNVSVKEWVLKMKASAQTSTRRYVKVALPTVHAGVGDALRQAFRMDGEGCRLQSFEDLLARLD